MTLAVIVMYTSLIDNFSSFAFALNFTKSIFFEIKPVLYPFNSLVKGLLASFCVKILPKIDIRWSGVARNMIKFCIKVIFGKTGKADLT